MDRTKTTVFWKTDIDAKLEVKRLAENEKLLNLAKGNCEHALAHEAGDDLKERCKYVYDLLQAFRPSRLDSEENDRVALCLVYLRLGYYSQWHEPFYKVPRACLVELYPALDAVKKRLELWRSVAKYGEVCKAARQASAYTVAGKSGHGPHTGKAGAGVPEAVKEEIKKVLKGKVIPENQSNN